MKKKYKVIAIHYGLDCNKIPKCKMCYTQDKCKIKSKNTKWFCNLIPHLRNLTEQVAIGSYGEPLLYPEFVKAFSKRCKLNNLICNMTTNGLLIQQVDKNLFDNLDMVSLSFNNELIKTSKDISRFWRNVKYLQWSDVKIGCNLLINKEMFNSSNFSPNSFKEIVEYLFEIGVENVYALYPKNYKLGIDITKYKALYMYLTLKYNGKKGKGLFVIDDLTKEILEQGYTKWTKPCHRGRGLLSINPDGSVSTCSFAKPFTYLKKSKDILNLKIPKKEIGGTNCPFLKI